MRELLFNLNERDKAVGPNQQVRLAIIGKNRQESAGIGRNRLGEDEPLFANENIRLEVVRMKLDV
jgi:hypothetical protein